jgi:hypothetical protein
MASKGRGIGQRFGWRGWLERISGWLCVLGRVGQWVFHRLFGVPTGEDEPALVRLRWQRRCWLRMIWLVVVVTAAWTVIEGEVLILILAFIDLGIFAMVIFGLVRVSWAIRREKRWLKRGR